MICCKSYRKQNSSKHEQTANKIPNMKKRTAPGGSVQIHILGTLHESFMLLPANIGTIKSSHSTNPAITAYGFTALLTSSNCFQIRVIDTPYTFCSRHDMNPAYKSYS